jgi:hypothetical protein
MSSPIEKVCSEIERFFEALAKRGAVELRPEELPPASKSELEALEEAAGASLPADVEEFLLRGLRHARGSVPETSGSAFASVGFDFIAVPLILRNMESFRELASEQAEDEDDDEPEESTELMAKGIPLSHSEPCLVVFDGGVYHFSVRNPVRRVTSSWTELLEHWLAAGCFSSHSYAALRPHVEGLVPAVPAEQDNLWLRYYERQFPRK